MGFQAKSCLPWNLTDSKEEWAETITLDAESLDLTEEEEEEEGKKPIICQIYKQGCIPHYSPTYK